MERLLASETSIGWPINPTIYNVDQIEKKLKQDNAFVSRVMEQPKIWIKEDEDVYRTINRSA
jgi:branched-subunit amino acid aminotransferase/4-amino-4-deoxychorismate lyase